MINYETTLRKNKNRLDRSKKNILLIGKGTKNEKSKIILNPININYNGMIIFAIIGVIVNFID